MRRFALLAIAVLTLSSSGGAATPSSVPLVGPDQSQQKSGGPIVFWSSDPINPDETALLFGDGLGATSAYGERVPDGPVGDPPNRVGATATFAGAPLQVLQQSNECAKVLLPATWKPGLFRLKLRDGSRTSDDIWLNRAEPWWWLADPGHTAHPGGNIRVFGKNFGPVTKVWLTQNARVFGLRTVKAEKYTVACTIPPDVPAGEYSLWVHNGNGGTFGFGAPLPITVRSQAIWPAQLFNVESFNAVGDATTDCTDGIQQALDAAKINGGGVVYIPQGVYTITRKLLIPEHTVLRGAGRDVTWLKVPHQAAPIDSVLAGNGDFAVENMGIVGQTPRRLIACPDLAQSYTTPWGSSDKQHLGRNVRLANLRLQHLTYGHRLDDQHADPRRNQGVGPTTVILAGPDMIVSDCDVVSSGMPLQLISAARDQISRNHINTGRNGWYEWDDVEECVFEGNTIEGRDLEASYGGIQNKAHYFYIANNNFHDAYGDEREALTFDAPYSPKWMGSITPISDNEIRLTGGEIQMWRTNELRGYQLIITSGRGLGGRAVITGNTGAIIKLAQPLPIRPTPEGLAAILETKSDVIITNNTMTDASVAVQLYSMACNFIIDGNTATRTGGMYGTGWDSTINGIRRFSPCWFNQWLGNRITDGFVYEQGPSEDGTLGAIAKVGLEDAATTPVLATIIRRNELSVGTSIILSASNDMGRQARPAIRDIVVEGNRVSSASPAIQIGSSAISVLLRKNSIHATAMPTQNESHSSFTDDRERRRHIFEAVSFALGMPPDALPAGGSIDDVHILREFAAEKLRHCPARNAREAAACDQLIQTLFGIHNTFSISRSPENNGAAEMPHLIIRSRLLATAPPISVRFTSNDPQSLISAPHFFAPGDTWKTILPIPKTKPMLTITIEFDGKTYTIRRPYFAE